MAYANFVVNNLLEYTIQGVHLFNKTIGLKKTFSLGKVYTVHESQVFDTMIRITKTRKLKNIIKNEIDLSLQHPDIKISSTNEHRLCDNILNNKIIQLILNEMELFDLPIGPLNA